MVAEENFENIRHEMALLARQKRCRTSAFTPRAPTEWQPHAVLDENDEPFTDAGAWDLVADLLECGYPIRSVVLRHPPGKRAYEMIVSLTPRPLEIYIKLQMGSGRVIGRSFHYSTLADTRSSEDP